jgi:crossover junction endodeoxyribonuclease RuvC
VESEQQGNGRVKEQRQGTGRPSLSADKSPLSTLRSPLSTRILGIDPGLNITGYGVLESTNGRLQLREAGVVRGKSRGSLARRLVELHDGVAEVIASLHPDAMALEELYSHYARPRTAILMGHARGVICLAAAQAGIPVKHYSATQIKRILTGSGRASKSQMQRAIQRELGLATAPEPPDVADALAAALCHYYLKDKPGTQKSGQWSVASGQ